MQKPQLCITPSYLRIMADWTSCPTCGRRILHDSRGVDQTAICWTCRQIQSALICAAALAIIDVRRVKGDRSC
jgi:hypothetical protein